MDDFTYSKLHQLLTKKIKPTSNHPEHLKNKKIYKQLENHIIILDAEPQIGKTGALISLLYILYEKYTNKILKKEEFFYSKDNSDIFPSKLKELTKYYCNLINEKDGIQSFLKEMGDSKKWKEYHDYVDESKKIFNLYSLIDPIWEPSERLIIADCGCGRSGLITHIREKKNYEKLEKLNESIHIYGFDVNEDIKKNEKDNDIYPLAQFTGIVGDMASNNDNIPKIFDYIIYSLSFFEDDISR